MGYSPWAHKRVRHNSVTKQQHHSEFVMANIKTHLNPTVILHFPEQVLLPLSQMAYHTIF